MFLYFHRELICFRTLSHTTKLVIYSTILKKNPKQSKSKWEYPDFLVAAHRGWSGAYPENTLLAIEKAITLGCDMIEFDINLSSDRKPVVFHDTRLERTTNGTGKLADYSYEKLAELDAGSWFDPQYKSLKIPSLAEVFALPKSKTIYNIEIKLHSWEKDEKQDNIEYQLIRSIKKYKLEQQSLISSFQWDFLTRIHKQAPELNTALLYKQNLGNLESSFKIPDLYSKSIATLQLEKLKEKYHCSTICVNFYDLNHRFVERCHKIGLKVITYTIDEYAEMEKYLNMNVDGIISNYPDRLLKCRDAHKKKTLL